MHENHLLSNSVFKALKIDPHATPDEPEEALRDMPRHDDEDPEAICGAIPFELSVSALGEAAIIDCRVNFIVELGDEGLGTIIDGMVSRYEILDWRTGSVERDGTPVRGSKPRWVPADLDLVLPHAVREKLDELTLEHAKNRTLSQA